MKRQRMVWSGLLAGSSLALACAASAGAASATPVGVSTHGPHMASIAPGSGHGKGKRPRGGSTSYLAYNGGPVVTSPHVIIVYWGSQWGSIGSNGFPTYDPSGEAPLQSSFFATLYGSGDNWSTTTTQYCSGVPTGTTQCNSNGTAVGQPSASPIDATWLDSGVTPPSAPSQADVTGEAVRAAQHFGHYGPEYQYIIDAPHGVEPKGFAGGHGGSYCAYHSSTSTSAGVVVYTNMPYMTDAGTSCGANFVTPTNGVNGATEGVTIVGGHEYAETNTDPQPSSGWVDSSGLEIGDKCAWITSGQGATAIVDLYGHYFAVQSLWSNNFHSDAGGCVIYYNSATSQG